MKVSNPLRVIGWYRESHPDTFWFGDHKPVHFEDEGIPVSARLINDIDDENELIGDIMTVADWLDSVECGMFIDYDGYGDQVVYYPGRDAYFVVERKDRFAGISPSEASELLPFTTHILWYNR